MFSLFIVFTLRGTHTTTTRLRGSRIEGYNPNPGGFGGGGAPPIGAERGVYILLTYLVFIPPFCSNLCRTRLREVKLGCEFRQNKLFQIQIYVLCLSFRTIEPLIKKLEKKL